MSKSIYDEVKDAFRDRIKNPFFGAFCVSWSIINYKLILVLASAESLSFKFNYIDNVAFRDQSDLYWRCITLPLATTAAYLLLFPAIGIFVGAVNTAWENFNAWIQACLSKRKTITAEEAVEMHEMFERKTAELKEIDRKRQEKMNSLHALPISIQSHYSQLVRGISESVLTNMDVIFREENFQAENFYNKIFLEPKATPKNKLVFPVATLRFIRGSMEKNTLFGMDDASKFFKGDAGINVALMIALDLVEATYFDGKVQFILNQENCEALIDTYESTRCAESSAVGS